MRGPFRVPAGLTPHRPIGAGGPQSPGEAPCAECQPWAAEARAGGPSHVASVQTMETFLSEAEWRLVRQASRDLGGGFAPVQTPYPQVSCGPEQSGAVREGSFVEEVSKLYEITIAVGLVEHDERFSSLSTTFSAMSWYAGNEAVRQAGITPATRSMIWERGWWGS